MDPRIIAEDKFARLENKGFFDRVRTCLDYLRDFKLTDDHYGNLINFFERNLDLREAGVSADEIKDAYNYYFDYAAVRKESSDFQKISMLRELDGLIDRMKVLLPYLKKCVEINNKLEQKDISTKNLSQLSTEAASINVEKIPQEYQYHRVDLLKKLRIVSNERYDFFNKYVVTFADESKKALESKDREMGLTSFIELVKKTKGFLDADTVPEKYGSRLKEQITKAFEQYLLIFKGEMVNVLKLRGEKEKSDGLSALRAEINSLLRSDLIPQELQNKFVQRDSTLDKQIKQLSQVKEEKKSDEAIKESKAKERAEKLKQSLENANKTLKKEIIKGWIKQCDTKSVDVILNEMKSKLMGLIGCSDDKEILQKLATYSPTLFLVSKTVYVSAMVEILIEFNVLSRPTDSLSVQSPGPAAGHKPQNQKVGF